MPITCKLFMPSAMCLLTSIAVCQQPTAQKIELNPPTVETTASYAVWRTDYYICTGIAYAKSLGKTVDDFAQFVGNNHSLEILRGKGLEPVVKLLNFVVRNYKNGTFEIIAESDSSVAMRSNRPYAPYFTGGSMLGVSLDEFERCLWEHIVISTSRIGLDFRYKIQGDQITSTLSIGK